MHIYISIVAAGITLWLLHGLAIRWQIWRAERRIERELHPREWPLLLKLAPTVALFVGPPILFALLLFRH